jgi:pimeloyl-ACP methyl ester carboxylesterase
MASHKPPERGARLGRRVTPGRFGMRGTSTSTRARAAGTSPPGADSGPPGTSAAGAPAPGANPPDAVPSGARAPERSAPGTAGDTGNGSPGGRVTGANPPEASPAGGPASGTEPSGGRAPDADAVGTAADPPTPDANAPARTSPWRRWGREHEDEPCPEGGDARAVVLVLPGGDAVGNGRPSGRRAAAVRPLARYVVRAAGPGAGLAAYVVRYRTRGWNGERADQAVDAAEAVEEVARRCGADVPVALVGVGVGARAALAAAGHPAVRAVVAVAPWLTAEGVEHDPVRQLIGRRVMVVHGTYDRTTPPDLSFRLAERAKKVNPDVCRFEVHGGSHRLDRHRDDVAALTADFVLGALLGRRVTRPVEDALAAPPPIGLRMPLDVGFGRVTGDPRPNDVRRRLR